MIGLYYPQITRFCSTLKSLLMSSFLSLLDLTCFTVSIWEFHNLTYWIFPRFLNRYLISTKFSPKSYLDSNFLFSSLDTPHCMLCFCNLLFQMICDHDHDITCAHKLWILHCFWKLLNVTYFNHKLDFLKCVVNCM